MRAAKTIAEAIGALAVAVWLGGLVALGALVAPVVFTLVTMPQSADAMTIVFLRFDAVAMTCAALALAAEAVRVVGASSGWLDRTRIVVLALAAAAAVYEGTSVSPRIAALHAAGAIRGLGPAGIALSRLHDAAEACGKAEVLLLLAVLALQAVSRARAEASARRAPS